MNGDEGTLAIAARVRGHGGVDGIPQVSLFEGLGQKSRNSQ
jgi:hypothetical protein